MGPQNSPQAGGCLVSLQVQLLSPTPSPCGRFPTPRDGSTTSHIFDSCGQTTCLSCPHPL